MSHRSQPIVVESMLSVSCSRAWEALTNHKEMVEWFFGEITSFEAAIGFETSFVIKSGERTFTHRWKITGVIPGRKIIYDWRYSEYPGQGTVTFELFDTGSDCRLRITNEGLANFPEEIPEFSISGCEAGWNYFLNRLKEYLENNTT